MTATTRLFRIVYGTLDTAATIGGANLTLYGLHELAISRDEFRLAYTVVVHHQTRDTFIAGCTALEDAVNTSRGAATVFIDGVDVFAASPSSGTGLNTRASAVKPGSAVDGPRSRLYLITVTGGLPPAGLSGRRQFEWTLQDLPSGRTLTATGVYTKVAATDARQHYLAVVDARIALITTALGGSWQLQSDVHTPEDEDHEVSFTRQYRLVTFETEPGTTVSTRLFGQAVAVNFQRTSSGALEGRPLIVVQGVYRSEVAYDQVTTGGLVDPAKMLALWQSTVRPHILAAMQNTLGREIAITSVSPGISLDPPGFQSTLVGVTTDGGETLLRRSVVTRDDVDPGKIITYLWPTKAVDPKDSKPTPAVVNQGPKRIARGVVETTTTVGGPENTALGSLVLDLSDPEVEGGSVVEGPWSVEFVERVEDVPGVGSQLRVTDKVVRALYFLVDEEVD